MPLFRALTVPITARWASLDGDGLSHLTLAPEGETIIATGVAIGDRDGAPYGVRYRAVCDRDWTARRLDLETTDGHSVRVRSDGKGAWTDPDGWPLAAFDGCIDIDLEGSPFTNTLPIRRLELTPDAGAVELRMLYVPFDDFRPFVDEQRYRCVESGSRYHYEAVDGSFTAEITVDQDGLVSDYPPLFRRIPLE